MDRPAVAVVVAVVMSGVGIAGDYFLKRASERQTPLATGWFLAGLVLYASTAFAWVFVMRHKLATIGGIYSVSMVLLLASMGVLFFEESLSRTEIAGIVLAAAALVLLARQG